MRVRIAMCLLCGLVCFSLPLFASAENGFTVREILKSNYLYLQAANQNGWLAVEESKKDEVRTILLGPNGYRRDLGSIIPTSEAYKTAYVTSISDDGIVYFETVLSDNEGTVLEREISSLSLDSDKARVIAKLTRQGSQVSIASVNSNGDLLAIDYDEKGFKDTVGLRTLAGATSLQRTFSFPNRIKNGTAQVHQYLDNQGRFLITREQYTNRRRKVVDICSGEVYSESISCATAEQINRVAYRGKGYISGLSDGRILVDTMGRYNLIDSATFQIIKSFRFPRYNNFSTYVTGQDLSTVGFGAASFNSSPRTPMTIVDPFLGGQKYVCDFIKKDASFLLPFAQIIKPSADKIFMVVDATGEGDEEDARGLYELSRSDTSFPDTRVVGSCPVRKKRNL